MTNLTLVWDNKGDAAALSGGSWNGSLPEANMQNRKLYIVSRTADAANASTIIRVDMGSVQVVQAVILAATGLSPSAQFRVRAFSDAYSTITFDSGTRDVFRSMFTPNSGSYYWGVDPVWTGKPSETVLNRYSRDLIYLLDTAQVYRYWQIELFDSTNINGYVDVGRLILGPLFTSTYNYDYGAKNGIEDLSVVDHTLGGSFSYDDRSKLRTFAFSLLYMSQSEAFQQVFEMDLQKGITGEVYLICNYGDDLNLLRTSFLGTLQQIDGITARTYGLYGKSFQLTELR